MSADHDYTRDDVNNTIDLDAYEIPSIAAESSADQIEMDRSRNDPPPGDHEFFVAGFLDKPKSVSRRGWYAGTEYPYTVLAIGVKLAMVADPTYSVVDFFDLPPADPGEQTVYKLGSKAADGKNAGFMFSKFAHFLGRLGFAVEKGQALPADALKLSNWKGRRIVATIEHQVQKDPTTGEPKVNPTTGEPYAPRAQVKLFSYRPSIATVGSVGVPAASPPAVPRQASPPPPTATAATAAAPRPPVAPAVPAAPLPPPAPAPAAGMASKLAGVL